MCLVQLLNEFFSLFEDLVVICGPNSLVKLRRQGRRIVGRVGEAKGDPVIVNSRVHKNAAISLFLPKLDFTLCLNGHQWQNKMRIVTLTDLDIKSTYLYIEYRGQYAEFDTTTPSVGILDAAAILAGWATQDSFRIFFWMLKNVIRHHSSQGLRRNLILQCTSKCSE